MARRRSARAQCRAAAWAARPRPMPRSPARRETPTAPVGHRVVAARRRTASGIARRRPRCRARAQSVRPGDRGATGSRPRLPPSGWRESAGGGPSTRRAAAGGGASPGSAQRQGTAAQGQGRARRILRSIHKPEEEAQCPARRRGTGRRTASRRMRRARRCRSCRSGGCRRQARAIRTTAAGSG